MRGHIVFKFRPYGPFEIPIEENEVAKFELNDFWKSIEARHPNLQDAVGCYIFAIHSRSLVRPWYVGKTEKASFKKEAFQLHKLELYRNILKIRKRGISHLYLIARITPAGKFRRAGKSGIESIRKLEELLIGACLIKNAKLANKSITKHLKEIQVPGYMNETPGARSLEAKHLAQLLGTKSDSNKSKMPPNCRLNQDLANGYTSSCE
jgi:hypothetical protein